MALGWYIIRIVKLGDRKYQLKIIQEKNSKYYGISTYEFKRLNEEEDLRGDQGIFFIEGLKFNTEVLDIIFEDFTDFIDDDYDEAIYDWINMGFNRYETGVELKLSTDNIDVLGTRKRKNIKTQIEINEELTSLTGSTRNLSNEDKILRNKLRSMSKAQIKTLVRTIYKDHNKLIHKEIERLKSIRTRLIDQHNILRGTEQAYRFVHGTNPFNYDPPANNERSTSTLMKSKYRTERQLNAINKELDLLENNLFEEESLLSEMSKFTGKSYL